jgi:Holliday junction resolvase
MKNCLNGNDGALKMDKSTCDFGRELENYIAEKFKELGFPNAKRSKGSGNQGQLGDITNQNLFIVEAKNRNTDSITIKEDVWLKLLSEIPLHSQRLALYILRNKNKQTWAVMDVDDFFTILKGYLENLNGRV